MSEPLQALLVAPEDEMRAAILSGKKTITIREGHRYYRCAPVMLCCHLVPWAVQADIVYVKTTTLDCVSPDEYFADGFESQSQMLERMRRFYPNLQANSPVTVIRWEDVRGALVDAAKDERQRTNDEPIR